MNNANVWYSCRTTAVQFPKWLLLWRKGNDRHGPPPEGTNQWRHVI